MVLADVLAVARTIQRATTMLLLCSTTTTALAHTSPQASVIVTGTSLMSVVCAEEMALLLVHATAKATSLTPVAFVEVTALLVPASVLQSALALASRAVQQQRGHMF